MFCYFYKTSLITYFPLFLLLFMRSMLIIITIVQPLKKTQLFFYICSQELLHHQPDNRVREEKARNRDTFNFDIYLSCETVTLFILFLLQVTHLTLERRKFSTTAAKRKPMKTKKFFQLFSLALYLCCLFVFSFFSIHITYRHTSLYITS